MIGDFGRTKAGQWRDGINIAARQGAPVLAAEGGIVAYAGEGIHGYGRLILLRHAEGYITTYAHNAALLVEVGDLVERGQVIARVGSTGESTGCLLHFELRKGRKPDRSRDRAGARLDRGRQHQIAGAPRAAGQNRSKLSVRLGRVQVCGAADSLPINPAMAPAATPPSRTKRSFAMQSSRAWSWTRAEPISPCLVADRQPGKAKATTWSLTFGVRIALPPATKTTYCLPL